jgi:rfaE bifunctional protein nucleotidyltransferase chain/domain
MSTIHVLVHVHVRPGRVEEFGRLARAHAACSRLEPGCLGFAVLHDADDPCRFALREEFRDAAALDAHRRTPHYLRWQGAVAALQQTPRQRHVMAPDRGKLLDAAALPCLGAAARVAGLRVVLANGCFDCLHPGHRHLLREARAAGDLLVAAADSDAGVRALKGPGRPAMPLAARVAALAALDAVDHAVTFTGDDELLGLIAALRPGVLAKGDEWRPAGVAGAGLVASWGGRVLLVPLLPGHSTTAALAARGNIL